MYHKDLTHSGYSAERISPPYDTAWTFQVDANYTPYTSIAVAGRKVYFGADYSTGTAANVYCIDTLGDQRWFWNLSGSIGYSTPCLANGQLYVNCRSGIGSKGTYCLDTADSPSQRILWTNSPLPSPCVGSQASITVDGARLFTHYFYTGSPSDSFFWINSSTGARQSAYATSGWGNYTWVAADVDDAYVYVLVPYIGLYRFPEAGGSPQLCPLTCANAGLATPALVGSRVFVPQGSDSSGMACVDTSTMSVLWRYTLGPGGGNCSPAVGNGVAYIGSGNKLYALNASTGSLLSGWPVTLGTGTVCSPSIADTVVFCGTSAGHFFAVGARSGAILLDYNCGGPVWDAPAIAGGKVYVATTAGKVFAFKSVRSNATILTVPYYGQAGEWCAICCASMILKYHQHEMRVWDVARRVAWTPGVGAHHPDEGEIISRRFLDLYPSLGSDLGEYILYRWGLQSGHLSWTSSSGFQAYLRTFVEDSACPVIITAKVDPSSHAVTVVGTSPDSFYVHDPSGALLRELGIPETEETRVCRAISWNQYFTHFDPVWNQADFKTFAIRPTSSSPAGYSLNVRGQGYDLQFQSNLHYLTFEWSADTTTGYGPCSIGYYYGGIDSQDFVSDPDSGLRYMPRMSDSIWMEAKVANATSVAVNATVDIQISKAGNLVYYHSADTTLDPLCNQNIFLFSRSTHGEPGLFDYPLALSCLGSPGLFRLLLRLYTDGTLRDTLVVLFHVASATSIADNETESGLTPTCVLRGGRPNPVRDVTRISYDVADKGRDLISVLDIRGRVVRVLMDAVEASGPHQATWDRRDSFGRRVPAGVYFCRLQAGRHLAEEKLLLVR